MKKNNPNSKTKISIFGIIWILVLIGLSVAFYLNFNLIRDFVLSLSFHPSAEISSLENKLDLTDRAKLIFAASNPTLNQSDIFNVKCDSNNPEVSVLGCYSADGQIYLYDIKTDELSGVTESTLSHELLHAVWRRLSNAEKNSITTSLEEIYQNNENIKNELNVAYKDNERLNEIFARAGTEIKDLPENLESVYARYFKDQDKIVDYYNQYSEPFNKLKAEAKALLAEIESLGPNIETKIASYQSQAATFSNEVNSFNNCANTAGCFSNSTFNSRRRELVNKQNSLNALYEEILANITHYNQLIEQYNNNSSQTNHLNNIINSNISSLEEL